MKKKLSAIAGIFAAFALVTGLSACGSSDADQKVKSDYTVELTARLTERDFSNYVLIEFVWHNNSDKSTSFHDSLEPSAYYDGVEVRSTNWGGDLTSNVQPGKSAEFYIEYPYQGSEIEIEITNKETGEIVTSKSFDTAKLDKPEEW